MFYFSITASYSRVDLVQIKSLGNSVYWNRTWHEKWTNYDN